MKILSSNYILKCHKGDCDKRIQSNANAKTDYRKTNSDTPYWAYQANSGIKNVSFGSNLNSNDFKNWLIQSNINPNSKEELSSFVDNSINDDNYLGEGTEQISYSIKNNDDYILKYPKDNLKKGTLHPVSDEFPTLNLGQAVAKIGNVKICKKQEGIESSIPLPKRYDGISDCQKIYMDHLLRVKNLPQKTYDDLAFTFAILNKKGKTFDYYNSNNILVDTKHKRFNIVDDLNESSDDNDVNTFLSIVNPLIDIRYMPNMVNKENVMPIWKEIIIKSFIASEKAGLPDINADIPSMKRMFQLANINPYEQKRLNKKCIA